MLIHRMKGVPELDDERNIMMLCAECHASGKYNAYEERVKFWKVQCARYGHEAMIEWIESLPLVIKPKWAA